MEVCKGVPHLAGIARKIDHHAAGVNGVDGEALRLEPTGDGLNIGVRDAEFFPELGGGEPLVEVGGLGVMQRVDKLLNGELLLGRAFELQHHVIEDKVVGDFAQVVLRSCLGAGVPRESHEFGFIRFFADQRFAKQGAAGCL